MAAQQTEKVKWSLAHRAWHWLNAALMAVVASSLVVESVLGRLHVPAGLLMGTAFLWRVVLFALADDRDVWTASLENGKKAWEAWRRPGASFQTLLPLLHKAGLKISHLAFFALLLVQMGTGIIMITMSVPGVRNPVVHFFKECHELSGWMIFIFTALHIAGVIRANLTDQPGIIRDMLDGGKA